MAQATTTRNDKLVQWRKRTLTITLSPLTVITSFICILVCWTCIFVLGVMAGRASSNEQPNSNSSTQQQENTNHTSPSEEEKNIIDASDLRYQRALKKKGLIAPASEQNTTPVAKNFKPAVAPTPETPGVTQPSVQAPVNPTSRLVQNTVPTENLRYDYVYQLATLPASESRRMDSLRESLEGEGFRTRVKRTGNQRALQLLIRGTPAVEEDVARVVKRLKLGEPWLRQKTLVK